VIQIFSYLGSSTSDLILKLLLGACGSPIYHPREFQKFWRPHSLRPNYWNFRDSRRAQPRLGFHQLEGKDLSFGLHTSGRGFPFPNLSFGRV
jgi:hypothetical protein